MRYLSHPAWDTGISPPELVRYIGSHTPGRALDLGCGSGTNVLTLARGGWQVTGIDVAFLAIRLARHKLAAAGIRADLQLGDVTGHLRLSGQCDLALDIGCFHAIERRREYLSNLSSWLRRGGHWLVYGFLRQGNLTSGISDDDIGTILGVGYRLVDRSNGVDHGERPSTWLLFEREGSQPGDHVPYPGVD